MSRIGGRLRLTEGNNAGLLDQLDLHVASVLVGGGMRLFDPAGLDLGPSEAIELTPTRVVDATGVTHIRYRVDGRSALGGDEPG